MSLKLQIINVYHSPRKFDERKVAVRHIQIKFLSSNVKKEIFRHLQSKTTHFPGGK